jgi:hypothetical protein
MAAMFARVRSVAQGRKVSPAGPSALATLPME